MRKPGRPRTRAEWDHRRMVTERYGIAPEFMAWVSGRNPDTRNADELTLNYPLASRAHALESP